MSGTPGFEYGAWEGHDFADMRHAVKAHGQDGWRVHTFATTWVPSDESHTTSMLYTVLFERNVRP